MAPEHPKAMTAPGVHEAAAALLLKHRRPPARLLDLAAGQGAFSRRAAGLGYAALPVVTVDLDQPFADRLGPGRFDACAALEIIEHLENPFQFLRQCRALLPPGGLLILSSPNVESIASRLLFLWNGRLRFFTADEPHHRTPIFGWQLQRALGEAGFVLRETAYNRHAWDCGRSPKARLGGLFARALCPVVRGDARGEVRVIAAVASG